MEKLYNYQCQNSTLNFFSFYVTKNYCINVKENLLIRASISHKNFYKCSYYTYQQIWKYLYRLYNIYLLHRYECFTPLIDFIWKYIWDTSDIFSISSLVMISLTSFICFSFVFRLVFVATASVDSSHFVIAWVSEYVTPQ